MTVSTDVVKQFAPILIFSQYEAYFPCSIDHLLGGQNCKLQVDGGPTIDNPTQQDLYNHPQAANHVIIDPSQYAGTLKTDPGATPLYYAVQEFDDGVEIDYIFLYAYQGGQTFWVTAPYPFDPVTWTYGVHQGDLERIAVRLVPTGDGQYRLLDVCYERHGEETWFPRGQVPMKDGRILVHPAMYGHSSTNSVMQVTGVHKGCPVVDDGNYLALQAVSVLASDSLQPAPLVWNPAEQSPLIEIGLNWSGEPVNDQLWAKYAGHLGQLQKNSLESGNYWAGGNLSGAEWAFLKSIDFFASPFLSSLTVGEGPTGPGSRYWIHPGSGKMADNQLLALWASGSMGITSTGLARLALDLTGSGSDVVVDFWSNDKKVAATIFGSDGQSGFRQTGGMSPGAPQEGYHAIAWLTAGLRSGGKQQALQLYNDGHGHLGVIVYGSDGGQNLTVLQQHDDTGQGWGFVNFSVADLQGNGSDQVVQFWNNGNVAAIVWGATNDDWFANLNAGSDNLGEGPNALAWLVADLRGDGKQEIVQLWHNKGNDHVGAVVYGASGSQLFTKLSHQDDLGEGFGALAWCVADLDGDGRDEIVQIWADGGNAFATVYGSDGSNGLTRLWRGSLGQGSGAVTWQVADLDGDGRDEIVQFWNNGGHLAAIVYGGGAGHALVTESTNGDLYQGPDTVSLGGWLTGNFNNPEVGEVVQFWNDNGALGMITYGTAEGASARSEAGRMDLRVA